ncbi:hypothetical protein POVWA2_044180 [Plasmodium ovale wallikeri]|uniref:Uncharacterized protein n=1 Tax=Plasmodium ovale wallikeri TaxID=864142 RepID=A0A1A8ZFM1_PLAOA|nr:hypothetical protein POVWA2_044180 [Plasmodium ovale wallikeri]
MQHVVTPLSYIRPIVRVLGAPLIYCTTPFRCKVCPLDRASGCKSIQTRHGNFTCVFVPSLAITLEETNLIERESKCSPFDRLLRVFIYHKYKTFSEPSLVPLAWVIRVIINAEFASYYFLFYLFFFFYFLKKIINFWHFLRLLFSLLKSGKREEFQNWSIIINAN